MSQHPKVIALKEIERRLACWGDMLAALVHVEAIMTIVPPRTAKAEYLAGLEEVRAAIAKATIPTSPLREGSDK